MTNRQHRRASRFAAICLVAGFAAAGLTGCAVGPDFQRPVAPDATRYTATAMAAHTASAPAPFGQAQRLVPGLAIDAQWWRALGSPALDGLIDEALQASPTLASARANLRQAQELVSARSGSTQFPQVDVGLGAQRQQSNPSSQGQSGDARQFTQQLAQRCADKGVQYETVVKAMDALQKAGVQRVGLSVKQASN